MHLATLQSNCVATRRGARAALYFFEEKNSRIEGKRPTFAPIAFLLAYCAKELAQASVSKC